MRRRTKAHAVTKAENNYDYVGQDPINGYDLSGEVEQAVSDDGFEVPPGGLDLGPSGDGGELWVDPSGSWGNDSPIFVAPKGVTKPKPYDPNVDYSSNPWYGDTLWDKRWNKASYHHDVCYGSQIKSRGACDSQFFHELLGACGGAGPFGILSGWCDADAVTWYLAVRAKGGSHYRPRHGD